MAFLDEAIKANLAVKLDFLHALKTLIFYLVHPKQNRDAIKKGHSKRKIKTRVVHFAGGFKAKPELNEFLEVQKLEIIKKATFEIAAVGFLVKLNCFALFEFLSFFKLFCFFLSFFSLKKDKKNKGLNKKKNSKS